MLGADLRCREASLFVLLRKRSDLSKNVDSGIEGNRKYASGCGKWTLFRFCKTFCDIPFVQCDCAVNFCNTLRCYFQMISHRSFTNVLGVYKHAPICRDVHIGVTQKITNMEVLRLVG